MSLATQVLSNATPYHTFLELLPGLSRDSGNAQESSPLPADFQHHIRFADQQVCVSPCACRCRCGIVVIVRFAVLLSLLWCVLMRSVAPLAAVRSVQDQLRCGQAAQLRVLPVPCRWWTGPHAHGHVPL